MHSVEHRFIAIVVGAILILVMPLIVLFLTLSSERIGRERLQSAEVLLEAGSKTLAKPLWDFDAEAVAQNARALVADHNVLAVSVRDTLGKFSVVFPQEPVDPALPHSILSRPIVYASSDGDRAVGVIDMYVETPSLWSRFSVDEVSIFLILLASIAVVFAAALISNRVTVIRPLVRLTKAIDATRLKGARHRVDWHADDEMGALVRKFNEMQERLEGEETALLRAHARATEIYNTTPAMLFSVDRHDRIVAVSDYWLMATGYDRADVMGRPFADFIETSAAAAYGERHAGLDPGAIASVTVPFIRADQTEMIVLILETAGLPAADGEDAVLAVMTDVTALKEAESERHRQAITDHLTGLLNRQGFEAALDRSILDANRRLGELACLFVDLDRFKWINDNFGHAVGDEVLRQVVVRMREALGPRDTLSRLGGDEFAILVNTADAEAAASAISDLICRALQDAIVVEGVELFVSCSIGIALYPVHADSAADLLLKADMAMYARKRDGKNGRQMFDASMLDAARERREVEECIEAGLKEDWFDVHLQPIVGMSDGRILGFEALMRLNHPELGTINPGRIIGIAEETGSIVRIGERLLEKSVRHLARIGTLEGTHETYMAINFSPLQFEPTLPHKLAALLLRHHVAPSRIVIEITEAVLMLDSPEVHGVLRQLGEFGCRIALDDFGTGYSSLSYLNRFPVDIVKIDQSFTRSLAAESAEVRRKSRMLIKGIRTIANEMGCTTVAEGIETPEDWKALKKLGINCGQGYLFSRPLTIEALITLLEDGSEAKEAAHPEPIEAVS